MPTADLHPKVLDRFTLRRAVGSGSAATVYASWDDVRQEEVALKVLNGRHVHMASSVQRGFREMAVLTKVSHPNVLKLLAHGDEPIPWLALELHSGSLKARVKGLGVLDGPTAADVIRDVCSGLQALHDLDVVHRDVKPDNVLMAHDGHALIADLGIARTTDPRITAAGQMLGSLMYMAPEQREDAHDLDARADQYGLGATVWYATVGRSPPDLSMLSFRPRLADQLPEEVRDVVVRATCHAPADRYDSMADMKAAISR